MRNSFLVVSMGFLILMGLLSVIGCRSFQTAYFGVQDRAVYAPKEFNQTREVVETAKQTAESPYAGKKIDESMAYGREAATVYWACHDQEAKDLLALARLSAYDAELYHPQPPPPQTHRSFHTPFVPEPTEAMAPKNTFAALKALPPRMVIASVSFGFNSYQLGEHGKDILDGNLPLFKAYPDIIYEIAGHTDFIGSEAYNQRLSEKRAKSVASHLRARGIPRANLVTIGYGESDPVASNETEAGQALNRRAEDRVLGSLLPDFGIENLELLPAGTTIEVIHFTHYGSSLLPIYQSLLDKSIPALKAHPRVKLAITGHSDVTGTNDTIAAISFQRALSVSDYLVSKGIDGSRIIIKAAGSASPVATNTTTEGRALNRRVEIKIAD